MNQKNKRSLKKSLVESNSAQELQDKSAFQGNEDKFQGFIENLPVMFYAVEPHPPYAPVYVSPAFEMFGYPLEQWHENSDMWVRVIHPDDREWVLEETEAAMRAGGGTDYEYRMVARNGDVYWVRDRSCCIRNEKGDVICWQGIILDITERKKAEDALTESEERYREIFENAKDLIYIHDLAGNYISVNKAAMTIFGYTQDEALTMNIAEAIVPEHLEFSRQMLTEKIAGTRQTAYEVDCIAKNGQRVTLEINSSIIHKDGEPFAVQGIARDVTERKRTEQALKESEEQYRDLFENANDLIYTHDLHGNFTSLNHAGEVITGYTREEALQLNVSQVVAPEFLDGVCERLARRVEQEIPTAYELEIITKQGHRVSLELSTRRIFRNNKLVGVQGIGRDITERKLTEKSLYKTVSLLTSTLESTADGILVVNEQGKVVTYNEKFLEMWRIPPQIIEHHEDARLVEFVKEQLKEPEKFTGNIEYLYTQPLATSSDILEFTDGRLYERYSQPHIREGKPVGRVWSFRDISERRRAEAKLMHHALHDPLTNLPNRPQFMNHLKTAIEQVERNSLARFAVLFLDLDRFKLINDSLGHTIGDKLLISIADRLKSCVRSGDVVARLGGDEFTILLRRPSDIADVARFAERLQRELSAPFKLGNYEVFTSASIGIIVSDDVRREPEDFLRDADAAMYRAKDAGKARFEIFDRDMHARNTNLLKLEMDLRYAVERNELELFYQPIVSLKTGKILEFEALLRWRHPQLGLITPDEFISVAEETGLIISIGQWILEESCQQISKWQKLYPSSTPLSISVNLSAKQLMHPTLTAQISGILEKNGLDSRHLKLEVTESTVMEHHETALGILNDLTALGISLSTDDFGTGFSSLSYLHQFPFKRLKIDRSFVSQMEGDAKSEVIVRTILMLGQSLNIEVVGEGVETEHQLEKLRSLGCILGQGYLFSKPLNAEDVGRLLQEGLQNINIAPFFVDGEAGNYQLLEAAEIQ